MKTVLVLLALVSASAALALPRVLASGTDCLLCEVAVRVAEDPADREAHVVEKKYNDECRAEFSKIPFIEKKCEAYGDAKLDTIIKELESGTAPEDVCTKIGECQSQ